MNVKKRIKKLEMKHKLGCFCGKTFVELCYGSSPLTYCPKCKDRFDEWARIAAEAGNKANLTDDEH